MKRAIRGTTVVNYMRFDVRDKESVEELKELLTGCYVNRVNLFGHPVLTVQHNESPITKEERTIIVNDGDYIIKYMYGALEVVSEQVFHREFTEHTRHNMNHWAMTGDRIFDTLKDVDFSQEHVGVTIEMLQDPYSNLNIAAQIHKILMDDKIKRDGLEWKTTDQ